MFWTKCWKRLMFASRVLPRKRRGSVAFVPLLYSLTRRAVCFDIETDDPANEFLRTAAQYSALDGNHHLPDCTASKPEKNHSTGDVATQYPPHAWKRWRTQVRGQLNHILQNGRTQSLTTIFAVNAGRRTLQSGVQDLLAERPCTMHVAVSIRSSIDQSSYSQQRYLVRWAKAGKR